MPQIRGSGGGVLKQRREEKVPHTEPFEKRGTRPLGPLRPAQVGWRLVKSDAPTPGLEAAGLQDIFFQQLPNSIQLPNSVQQQITGHLIPEVIQMLCTMSRPMQVALPTACVGRRGGLRPMNRYE